MFRGDIWKPGNQATAGGYSRQQVRSVIAALGLDVKSETGGDYLILCPFHNNVNTPACEVQKNQGLYFCFACGERGNLLDLVMHVNKSNLFESIRFIAQYESEDGAEEDPFEDDVPSTVSPTLISALNNNAVESEEAKEYFAYRGITEESIKTYLLGYSPKLNMVTVPVRNEDGTFAGFVGRLRSKTEKAFKNSSGFKRKFCLFNLDSCLDGSTVFVTDATFDAIRLAQLGYPAVATMGGLTTDQALMLGRYFGTIYIVSDNGPDGKPDHTSQRNLEKARAVSRKSVSMIDLPPEHKDVGSMSDTEITEVINKQTGWL